MPDIATFIDLFIHLDKHLDILIKSYGSWTYVILFLIVFCETGLVVTPLLPGDSLLFAVGSFAALGSLNLISCMILLFIAAVLGDGVNYHIGKYMGASAFEKKNSRIFKKEYLRRTQAFYEKYGGKTIIIARFVPIVRTFAPFLAGVGVMNYRRFLSYNVTGAALWVFVAVGAGYLFGNIPIVKNNFTLVILAIIIVSLLPAVFEVMAARRAKARANIHNGTKRHLKS